MLHDRGIGGWVGNSTVFRTDERSVAGRGNLDGVVGGCGGSATSTVPRHPFGETECLKYLNRNGGTCAPVVTAGWSQSTA